jgi:hypothetical protein
MSFSKCFVATHLLPVGLLFFVIRDHNQTDLSLQCVVFFVSLDALTLEVLLVKSALVWRPGVERIFACVVAGVDAAAIRDVAFLMLLQVFVVAALVVAALPLLVVAAAAALAVAAGHATQCMRVEDLDVEPERERTFEEQIPQLL